MIQALMGATGGSSYQSTATSKGEASSGSGSVNIGGFNPPAFGGGSSQLIALGIVAVAVVLYLVSRRK